MSDNGYPGWPGTPGGGPPPAGYPGGPAAGGGYPAGPPQGGAYDATMPAHPAAGYGAPPPGYPVGPTNAGFPPQPPRPKKTGIIVGAVGAVVVVIVAVVLVFALKDDGKSGSASSTGSPTPSATSDKPTTTPTEDDPTEPPTSAPATSAPATSAPATTAAPTSAAPTTALALPASIKGKPRLTETGDIADAVAKVNGVFTPNFSGVSTRIYGTSANDSQPYAATTATKRSTVPSDYVRTFVPSSAGATEMPVTWSHPGLLRCWLTDGSTSCLWGDDNRLIYLLSPVSAAESAAVVDKIYLGQTP